MRRLVWLVFLPASLAAQRPPPAVAPVLPRLLARAQDTTVSVWLFAHPGVSLETLSERAIGLGARVRVRSRWLHAISADVSSSALRALLQDRDLRRIQPLGRFRRRPRRPGEPLIELAPVAPRSPTAPGDTCGFTTGDDPVLGPSEMPYRRLHLRPLTDAGVDGTGVRIAILDTGFDTANPAFAGVTITAQRDFIFGDDNVRDEAADVAGQHGHGTATWSLFAADIPGRIRGIARGALFLLAKTEDTRSEMRVEEDNYVAALEWADSVGVDIVSSSLAYLIFDNGFRYTPGQLNGDVAVTTMAADMAAQRGILVLTAASNEGPGFRTIWTPGDADSILTVGAEDSTGAIATFSSRGPTADGRLKPDFTAPGVAVCAVTGVDRVERLSGTSFATPLLAASAALLKQLHPTLSPMQIRTAFRNTGSRRTAPDSTFGWGLPDVGASAVFPSGIVALGPVPSAGPLTTITPTFSWTVGSVPSSARPVTYRLRVGRDTAFATSLFDTTLTVETYNLVRPLKPGTLHWQVDATAATGETASTGVVGPLDVPPWVTLLTLSSPAGTVTDSAQPTFEWRPIDVAEPPGPFVYDLQVQRVETGNYDFGIGGISDTFYTLPQPLERNTSYRWAVVVHAGADTTTVRSQGSFLIADPSTPASTLLYQNFPNPFPIAGRDSTCLWFDLAVTARVEFEILDLRGNRVRRFVPGPDFSAPLPAGRYGRGQAGGGGICDPRLMWDGRADNGHPLPAGVYLAKLKAPGLLVFKRIVFRGK